MQQALISALRFLCLAVNILPICQGTKFIPAETAKPYFNDGQTLETWLYHTHAITPQVKLTSDSELEEDDSGDAFLSRNGQIRGSLNGYQFVLSPFSPKFHSPPSSFARAERGRLGRMPIAYGKRQDTRVGLPLRNDEKDDHYGDESDSAFLTSGGPSSGQDHFSRDTRQRLQRMPLNFGKRLVLPAREGRGKLHRMPLTFGKRNNSYLLLGSKDSLDLSNAELHPKETFGREARARLNRMPIAFGKRNMERFLRSRLGRMPMTFGKRTDESSSEKTLEENSPENETKEESKEYNDDTNEQVEAGMLQSMVDADAEDRLRHSLNRRSRLNRMPLTFGKRGRLGRMPMAFGKRDNSVASLNKLSALLDGDVTNQRELSREGIE